MLVRLNRKLKLHHLLGGSPLERASNMLVVHVALVHRRNCPCPMCMASTALALSGEPKEVVNLGRDSSLVAICGPAMHGTVGGVMMLLQRLNMVQE